MDVIGFIVGKKSFESGQLEELFCPAAKAH